MSRKLSGDKLLKANRRNNIESARLGFRLEDYDKERRLITKYIEQEKKTVKNVFDNVKRTTGASEEGRTTKIKRRNSSVQERTPKSNIQLSERRLSQWRVCEKQLKKIISMSDLEKSNTNDQDRKSVTRPPSYSQSVNESIRLDSIGADDISNGNYQKRAASRGRDDVFVTHRTRVYSVDGYMGNNDSGKDEETNDCPFEMKVRPQTTKSKHLARQFSRKMHLRPTSAYPVKKKHGENYPSRKLSCSRISFTETASSSDALNRYDNDQRKRGNTESDTNGNFNVDEVDIISKFNGTAPEIVLPSEKADWRGTVEAPVISNANAGPEEVVSKWELLKRTRPFSEDPAMRLAQIRRANINNSIEEPPALTRSQRKAEVSANPQARQLRVSWAEGSEDENDQLNWRELVHTRSSSQVLTNMASVGKVLQAAMAFSKVARKKALEKMVEKKSTDRHEIIRQERLRRLQSRASLLKDLASQWHSHNGNLIMHDRDQLSESKIVDKS